jgi:hypothetical protein
MCRQHYIRSLELKGASVINDTRTLFDKFYLDFRTDCLKEERLRRDLYQGKVNPIFQYDKSMLTNRIGVAMLMKASLLA